MAWQAGALSGRPPSPPPPPGVKPVLIELTDMKTKKVVDTLEVDACLVATGRAPYTQGLNLAVLNAATDRRGFIPVSDKMEVCLGVRE